MKKSDLADWLWIDLCKEFPKIRFEREFAFHPKRKWRFDFACPAKMLGIEVQGGIFAGGRHSRGAALMEEYEKLNAAAAMGFRVLFFDGRMIKPPAEHRGPARTAAEARRRALEDCAIDTIRKALG